MGFLLMWIFAIYLGVGNFVYSFLDVVIHYFPCVTGPSAYSIILCTHYILLFTNWLTSFIQYSGGRLAKKVPYAPQTPSLKLIINTVFDLLHACFIKCHQTNEKNNCHHEQKYFFPPPEVPNPSLPGWKGTFEYKQTSNTSAQWRVGRRKGNGHVLGPWGGGITLRGAD